MSSCFSIIFFKFRFVALARPSFNQFLLVIFIVLSELLSLCFCSVQTCFRSVTVLQNQKQTNILNNKQTKNRKNATIKIKSNHTEKTTGTQCETNCSGTMSAIPVNPNWMDSPISCSHHRTIWEFARPAHVLSCH